MFTFSRSKLLVGLFFLCVRAACPVSISDDFENGIIDPTIWTTGGWALGVGGLGSGGYSWSTSEVAAVDGYVDINVQGPTSGNTYGGYAYLQSLYDYNDGDNHLINFTWGAEVNADHLDHYAIQVTSGVIPTNDLYWVLDNPKNLYFSNPNRVEQGQVDLPATDWSVRIDALARTASLFDASNGLGNLLNTISLDPLSTWQFAFINGDGTSRGYAGTNNSMYIYDYESTSSPASAPLPELGVVRTPVILNNVSFDFDKAMLKPEGEAAVDKLIAEMKKWPADTVLIEGHTDAIGSDAYNMALGQRRADAVRSYMVEQGIDTARIQAVSKGEVEPVVANDTPVNRKLNRRAEFNIQIVNQ